MLEHHIGWCLSQWTSLAERWVYIILQAKQVIHLLRQLEKFWPLPPGYDFEKSIDIGENKTEHIKGNIENLNMS